MRILLLNYEFPPLGGGAGNATYYILKEFSKIKDLKVDLVTSSTNHYKEEDFSNKIKIYYLNISKSKNWHHQSLKELILYSIKSYFFCKKLTKNHNYSLIYAFFGIPSGYIAMKLGLPYIVSLRGSDVPFYNKRFYWLDKLLFKRLSRKIWQKAKKVIANSQELKDIALKSSSKQKIKVISNGVDTEEFKPKLEKHNIFTVISTSRLIRRKGVEYLIDAFINFNKKYKNTKLIIVGDGDLKQELINKVENNKLKKNINFIGKVNHNNILKYYQTADVFVLPSMNEGMSNSLLEAMASELAIISTNTGGAKELINSKNGIIVKKKDSKSIENSLEQLYKDRLLLSKMKISSRKKAIKMNWNKVANQYLKLYED